MLTELKLLVILEIFLFLMLCEHLASPEVIIDTLVEWVKAADRKIVLERGFLARVRNIVWSEVECGASIVGLEWVVTSATCAQLVTRGNS